MFATMKIYFDHFHHDFVMFLLILKGLTVWINYACYKVIHIGNDRFPLTRFMEITTRATNRSHSSLFKLAAMGRGKPTDRWGGGFALPPLKADL